MKKIIASVLTVALLLSCFGMVAQAKVGDKIGTALHTDIVAYINHYAIPSFAVNGQSVVVAEDLQKFGFDVFWNQHDRTLTIERNGSVKVRGTIDVKKEGATGTKFTDILETDIKVFAGGQQIKSYAIKGYTMIPIEALTMFGEVHWVEYQRAVKLWVDGLQIRPTMQSVEKYVAPKPSTPAPKPQTTQTTPTPPAASTKPAYDPVYFIASDASFESMNSKRVTLSQIEWCPNGTRVSLETALKKCSDRARANQSSIDLNEIASIYGVPTAENAFKASIADYGPNVYLIVVNCVDAWELYSVNKTTGEVKYCAGGQESYPGMFNAYKY